MADLKKNFTVLLANTGIFAWNVKFRSKVQTSSWSKCYLKPSGQERIQPIISGNKAKPFVRVGRKDTGPKIKAFGRLRLGTENLLDSRVAETDGRLGLLVCG